MSHKILSLSVVFLFLASCVTRADVEEMKSNQEKIIEKLEKGGGAARRQPPQRPKGPDPAKTYAFPAGDSPAKGATDAWVTVIEISEFQCPYCKRATPTMEQIAEKYSSDVRVVFKHNPLSFHQNAMPAAMASECAREQGKFWEMHDALFENQRELSVAKYEEAAKKIGLNFGQWQGCYKENKYKDRILTDQRTATMLGARGTPAFFVNGRFLSGAQPLPAFEKLIDEEMKKAKASGIAKRDYYNKVIVAKGQKRI